MTIPTEPIGSIPRPPDLLAAMAGHERGEVSDTDLAAAQDEAIRDTIRRLEETGSAVVTDGEQSKPSFVTYPIAGLSDLAPDGIVIPFADGHQRQLPVLTAGPFRYQVHADTYLRAALGTCDDCGFAPFADDTSTSRDIAFAKIAARVEGTALAAQQLGL